MKFKALLILVVFCTTLSAQNISINETGNPPHSSAILDLQSLTKGFLAPRMTMAQRNSIPLPAIGLTIFQTDNMIGYYYYNGASWVVMSSGGSTGHWTSNGTAIYNTNAGNVGIGLTTPLAPLHVQGNFEAVRVSGDSPYIQFYNAANEPKGWIWQGPGSNLSIGTHLNNTSGRLEMYNSGNLNMSIQSFGGVDIYGSSPSLNLRNATSGLFGEIYKNQNDMEIAAKRVGIFATPGNLILQTSIISEFSNAIAGKVGIGTRTPEAKLHLAADLEAMRIEGVGYSYLSFYNGASYKGFLVNDQNNIGLGTSSVNSTGVLWFYVGAATRMTILPNGNVGIGTTNPVYKLAVNGTIRTKEVIVETGWADYVFDKEYRLRPLEEVEAFIRENQHLPGVPAASKIQSEGLALGDTQRQMMEKIEELTLYVIALKKEIELLKLK